LAAPPAGSGGNGDNNSDKAGGALNSTPTGTKLAGLLVAAAGPGERYGRLDDKALVDAITRWDAEESWAYGRKLAAIREMVRRNPLAGHEAAEPGGMPGLWRATLDDEVALALRISQRAADSVIALSRILEVRLPLTSAALDAGILTGSIARMIADETSVLSDEDARKAEAMIAGWWKGRTWGQISKKLAAAVVNVDPDGARRRREREEREQGRVRLYRERAGTAGLIGSGLPTDRALMAMRAVQARARAYKRWGIAEPMDLLRVRAYLDLLTQTDSRTQFPKTTPGQDANGNADGDGQEDGTPDSDAQEDGTPDNSSLDAEPEDDFRDDFGDEDFGDDGPEADEPGDGDGGPGGSGPGGAGPDSGGTGGGGGLPANLDLAIPLLGLLGLVERAGEAHSLGVLDPGLARQLAAAAARDPRSSFGVIVTDSDGHAIGYGRARKRRPTAARPPEPGLQGQLWPEHDQPRPDNNCTMTFTPAGPPPDGGYGDQAGYGSWILVIGDLELTVTIDPIPGGECDHRYETAGYRPSARLRRLVQIRDGECVFPVCVRHPRGTDFEHAIPWPAGRTCSCNGSCRCRHDHLVKQSKGWKVKQLPGGVHQWTTPSGKTYSKGPREYPI
jgi:Domain of unknown function (DUF222)